MPLKSAPEGRRGGAKGKEHHVHASDNGRSECSKGNGQGHRHYGRDNHRDGRAYRRRPLFGRLVESSSRISSGATGCDTVVCLRSDARSTTGDDISFPADSRTGTLSRPDLCACVYSAEPNLAGASSHDVVRISSGTEFTTTIFYLPHEFPVGLPSQFRPSGGRQEMRRRAGNEF